MTRRLLLGLLLLAAPVLARAQHTVLTTDQTFSGSKALTGDYTCNGGVFRSCAFTGSSVTDGTYTGPTLSDPDVTNLSPCSGGSALGVDASNNMCTNPTATGTITGGTTAVGSCTDTTVLFTDAGVLGCDTDLKWNKTTNTITLASDLLLSRDGAGNLQLGADTNTPVQQIVSAGDAISGSSSGSAIVLAGGASSGVNQGGSATVSGGLGGSTDGQGGSTTIQGGTGGTTNGAGGLISIVGGQGTGSGNGGNAIIDGGTSGSGTVGNVLLATTRGQTVVGGLGIDYTDSDTNPSCSAGVYMIYADTSETKLKKCQNGTVTDLAPPAATLVVGNSATSDGTTFMGTRAGSNTEANVALPLAISGTASSLYCASSAAPGASASWVMTLRIAGSDTTVTCTITDPATTCNDTTHSTSVTAGNLFSIKIVEGGTSGDGPVGCTFKIL